MEEILSLYSSYPTILPSDQYTQWEGYLGRGVHSCRILILTPKYPSLAGIILKTSNEVRSKIVPHLQHLSESATLTEFLQTLQHILQNHGKSFEPSNLWNRDYIVLYKVIHDDLKNSVGSENVADIDGYLKWIKLKYTDTNNYIHHITIGLSLNYPNIPLEVIEVDLPTVVTNNFKQVGRLGDLYDEFKSVVDSLQHFWTEMDNLSVNTWVVEPEIPKKKDIHRRILLSESLSLLITFHPLQLSAVPDVKFLGSLNAVNVSRVAYQQNLESYGWNEDADIIENIRTLCSITDFPQKPINMDEINAEKECFICFATQKPNQPPPAKFCSDPKCASYYHWDCLNEWLTTITTSSDVYEFISGPCPYCNQTLWCPKTHSINQD